MRWFETKVLVGFTLFMLAVLCGVISVVVQEIARAVQ